MSIARGKLMTLHNAITFISLFYLLLLFRKELVAARYSVIKGFLRVVLAQAVFVLVAQLTFCGEP